MAVVSEAIGIEIGSGFGSGQEWGSRQTWGGVGVEVGVRDEAHLDLSEPHEQIHHRALQRARVEQHQPEGRGGELAARLEHDTHDARGEVEPGARLHGERLGVGLRLALALGLG